MFLSKFQGIKMFLNFHVQIEDMTIIINKQFSDH